MATLTARVDVALPAADTFAAATDWPGQRSWVFATRVRPTRGTGHDVGDEISARTGFGPLGFTDTMTITDWRPPYECRVRHTGWLVRGTAIFAVESTGPDTSAFVWTEGLDLPLGRFGGAGFAVTRPLFAYFVQRSLNRFAQWAPTRR